MNKNKGWKHIYADRSKSEIRVGVTATTGNRTESALLPIFSSIFTAETHEIHLALNTTFAKKGELLYNHRLKKRHTSATKTNSDQTKSTKI